MPRRRRYLISKQTSEITIRAKEGLPFPPAEHMNLLILSALVRVQRGSKVVISHFVVMSNHIHFLVVYDQQQAMNLLREIKGMLSIKYLNLWEDSSIILYPTEEDIRYRIACFYSNPAKAGLETSIEKYSGASSWKASQRSSSSISDEVTISYLWISADNIPMVKQ